MPNLLDDLLTETIKEKVDEATSNLERLAEDAVEEATRGLSKQVEEAVEEATADLDLRDQAKDAVDVAIADASIDDQAETAVTEALAEKLPATVEEALFRLLQRPDVAERLVTLLFEKAE